MKRIFTLIFSMYIVFCSFLFTDTAAIDCTNWIAFYKKPDQSQRTILDTVLDGFSLLYLPYVFMNERPKKADGPCDEQKEDSKVAASENLIVSNEILSKYTDFWGNVREDWRELYQADLKSEAKEKERQRKLQEWQLKRKEYLCQQNVIFKQQSLRPLSQKYGQILQERARNKDIYSYNEAETARIALRKKVMDFMLADDSNAFKYPRNYYFDERVSKELENKDIDPQWFKYVYGNNLQQILNQESIDVINEVGKCREQNHLVGTIGSIADSTVEFAALSHEYNVNGYTNNAIKLLDFCWNLLDYTKAVGEGIAIGVYNSAVPIAEGIATGILIGACPPAGFAVAAIRNWSTIKLAGQALSVVLTEVVDIGFCCGTGDFENVGTKYTNVTSFISEKCDLLCKAIERGEGRELVKNAVALGTELALTHKCLKITDRFCKRAGQQAIQYFEKSNFALANAQQVELTKALVTEGYHLNEAESIAKKATRSCHNGEAEIVNQANKIVRASHEIAFENMRCGCTPKNGYYEVNGFKFTEYYYNRLWRKGRGAPSLVAGEILKEATIIVPDEKVLGFYRYETHFWEMIYNPTTKIVAHMQPISSKKMK